MQSKGSEAGGFHPLMVETFKHEWKHLEVVFPRLVLYNMAHLIVAAESGAVPEAAASALVAELETLNAEGPETMPQDPRLDGLQPNIEAELSRRLGAEVGGWLNTGRARQECEFVARQIANRDQLVQLIGEVVPLASSWLQLAARESESVMPYATWAQHAEPITFGYYAASLAEGLLADLQRMRAAYASLSRGRADIGQVVPSPLPIDRNRVAGLLGFETVMGNSLYAYASLDAELEALSALAILMGGLARAAENLYVWSTPEFGFLRFGTAFSGTSYLMPQKRNPFALRMVRPVAAQVSGAWNDAMQLFAGGLPMVGNGVIHVPNRLLESLGPAMDVVRLLAMALPTLELDRPLMRRTAQDHWAQAPQLAYLLVREHGLSFRLAHHVVAQVVRNAVAAGTGPSNLEAAAVEAAVRDVAGRELTLAQDAVSRALDVDRVVASRKDSGPAPEAVLAHVEAMNKELAAVTHWLDGERSRLEAAGVRLRDAAVKLGKDGRK
jgi:argininosuccinate lyase